MPRASRTISTNIVPSKDNAHGFTLNLFPSPWRNPKRRARVDQQLVREATDNRSVSCVFISDEGEFTGILAGISAGGKLGPIPSWIFCCAAYSPKAGRHGSFSTRGTMPRSIERNCIGMIPRHGWFAKPCRRPMRTWRPDEPTGSGATHLQSNAPAARLRPNHRMSIGQSDAPFLPF